MNIISAWVIRPGRSTGVRNLFRFGIRTRTGFRNRPTRFTKAFLSSSRIRAGLASGILLDNTWRTNFDFGKQLPGVYSFGAIDGPLDYYVIYGPSAKQVVKTYAWLTGTAPLPALWTLGFQQSRYTYVPQSQSA